MSPLNTEDLERLALVHSPHFQAPLEQSRESIKVGKGLSRDAFWRAVEQRGYKKNEPVTARSASCIFAALQCFGLLE